MRPLMVDLEIAWRGGQNQALLILKGLQARGHEPELVAARGSALGERAAAAHLPVHYVPRGWLRLPAARAVQRVLAKKNPDIVHANEAHAVSAVWLARAHRRVPLVISRRVGYPIGQSRVARSRYRAAARIVANSRWVADQAEASGAPREKLTIVFEGAEVPRRFTVQEKQAARSRWQQAEGAPLLGCVGVLSPDKGQRWLVRATAELRHEFPGLRLLLAGDGPCRSELQALASQLGVGNRVIFAGFVKDVESVYAALDVFLLPSLFEGLNNSLLAAMAYEIPSIAFRRGALPEIIEDGASGLLTEAANLPELIATVRRLLRDPALARSLGSDARHRIETTFSADRMVDGMVRVYEEALALGGSCAPRALEAAL